MSYVDLNPIRSRMADRPETSDHTSIKQCIQHQAQTNPVNPEAMHALLKELLAFAGYPRKKMGVSKLPRLEAQQDILQYIAIFYNGYRLHSTLNYVSPNEYERQFNEMKKVA